MRWVRGARKGRGDRGAATVEFALVMVPLIYLVFGLVQYGMYFYSMQAGTSAVSDGVRRLSVGDCQDTAALQTFLRDRLGAATTTDAASLDPVVSYTSDGGAATGTPEVGGTVTLTLAFPATNMNFPLIPLPGHGEVTRSVFARVEDTNASTLGCS